MLTLPHRRFNRAIWKLFYRRFRIVNREMTKVWLDQLMWGIGHYNLDEENLPHHIPLDEIKLPDSKSPPPAPSSDPSDSQSDGPRS